jgi:hypothetical protein
LAGLPEFDLIIVGEGPERAAIGALAQELRLADRVRLLGRVPQDRLADIYTAADLLLLASTSEGWPNVLLESMACGTAVIVSAIDDIADISPRPRQVHLAGDDAEPDCRRSSRLFRRAARPRRNPRVWQVLQLVEHDGKAGCAVSQEVPPPGRAAPSGAKCLAHQFIQVIQLPPVHSCPDLIRAPTETDEAVGSVDGRVKPGQARP